MTLPKLPQILTINPSDWARSKAINLEDCFFIELDSRSYNSYEEALNGKDFSKVELEDRVREYAAKNGCEVVVGYVPMIDPARRGNLGDSGDIGHDIQYHFKATGIGLIKNQKPEDNNT